MEGLEPQPGEPGLLLCLVADNALTGAGAGAGAGAGPKVLEHKP